MEGVADSRLCSQLDTGIIYEHDNYIFIKVYKRIYCFCCLSADAKHIGLSYPTNIF